MVSARVESHFSLPASTSWAMATAVNILSIEPMRNLVSWSTGTPKLRSAVPRHSSRSASPPTSTVTQPEKSTLRAILSKPDRMTVLSSALSTWPLGQAS